MIHEAFRGRASEGSTICCDILNIASDLSHSDQSIRNGDGDGDSITQASPTTRGAPDRIRTREPPVRHCKFRKIFVIAYHQILETKFVCTRCAVSMVDDTPLNFIICRPPHAKRHGNVWEELLANP